MRPDGAVALARRGFEALPIHDGHVAVPVCDETRSLKAAGRPR